MSEKFEQEAIEAYNYGARNNINEYISKKTGEPPFVGESDWSEA